MAHGTQERSSKHTATGVRQVLTKIVQRHAYRLPFTCLAESLLESRLITHTHTLHVLLRDSVRTLGRAWSAGTTHLPVVWLAIACPERLVPAVDTGRSSTYYSENRTRGNGLTQEKTACTVRVHVCVHARRKGGEDATLALQPTHCKASPCCSDKPAGK